MANNTLHEPPELLTEETRNMHRAIVSLIEELEAVDWYQQRADACSDPALREILLHNKNEEIEHAMMSLEWIRRHDTGFAHNARTYLFSERPITAIEDEVTGNESQPNPAASAARTVTADGSLGIGSLKE